MIFRIEPQPTPEETAAIEIAIKRLMRRTEVTTRKLRYRDIVNDRANSTATWRDTARIELLDPGV